jgi:N-acetylneuraminic acid mutarotase
VVKESWTQLFPKPAPSSRTGQELDYDAESDRVIMFGGCHQYWIGYGCENDETFVFDPKKITWKRMSDGPKGLLGARMVYDAESDRMILFGGLDFRAWVYLADTWAYDYNTDTWTEMTPSESPPGRNYQAMTYDAKADRVLTWGGMYPDDLPLPESVWAYDYNTNTWKERVPVGDYPKSRDYAQMAYDAESDITILFGGLEMAYPDGSIDTDVGTWAYDYNSNTWQKMNPVTEPPSLSRHAMVYVKDIDRIILFGGESADGIDYNFSSEFWMYDYNTNTWTNLNP